MIQTIPNFQLLSDYDDVLVADEHGKVIFFDLADAHILKLIGVRPEDFLGKKVTALYPNLPAEKSTIMHVLRSGEPLPAVKQHVETFSGQEVAIHSATYPICVDGKIIGAIEFSKHYYELGDIDYVNQKAKHPIYRNNNTLYTVEDIMTHNPKMQLIKEKVIQMAKSHSAVLIYGKTGTGKEMVAQAIHNASNRFDKPFVALNCGAVPVGLMESTLFGTVKGSFTGANDSSGIFEQAKGGTVFLDELNSLPLDMQVKLLKVVEEKRVRRLGGQEDMQLDFRIIAATNEHPFELIEGGKLREDLYYRLSILQIDLPTLKERPEDIELLTKYYINRYNDIMHIRILDIEEDVLDCFKAYHWPGNIRQLKNSIETAYHNVQSTLLTLEDVPDTIKNSHLLQNKNDIKRNDALSLKEQLEQIEIAIIQESYVKCGENISQTARSLNISKQTLHYKMQKYKLI
ncbi:sigma-54 interaction domain-containing protein [Solibacillus sp. FSL H8-0538]|uniref:sigma-54 interaction domain-containing protein n=1 Tax=Solibacillus sp. FSL H8-0538 TaxID=2921400 RepID=UPI0030FB04DD